MPRPYQMTQSSLIAGTLQGQQNQLAARTEVPLPCQVGQGDVHRQSRLQGITEGLLPTLAEGNVFETRLSEIRQASANITAFRQALYLLMRLHQVDGPARNALMQRCMQWYRARAAVERPGGSVWAKSFVKVAQAQAGKWE